VHAQGVIIVTPTASRLSRMHNEIGNVIVLDTPPESFSIHVLTIRRYADQVDGNLEIRITLKMLRLFKSF
jgi:hypothetical protein